jgi:hypothetical protein
MVTTTHNMIIKASVSESAFRRSTAKTAAGMSQNINK